LHSSSCSDESHKELVVVMMMHMKRMVMTMVWMDILLGSSHPPDKLRDDKKGRY
jgi:hypothetical protein